MLSEYIALLKPALDELRAIGYKKYAGKYQLGGLDLHKNLCDKRDNALRELVKLAANTTVVPMDNNIDGYTKIARALGIDPSYLSSDQIIDLVLIKIDQLKLNLELAEPDTLIVDALRQGLTVDDTFGNGQYFSAYFKTLTNTGTYTAKTIREAALLAINATR